MASSKVVSLSKSSAKRKVNAYIKGVISGRIVVGKWVRLSVERHVRDLKEAHKRGLYFDEDAAHRVIRFFHRYLRHSKGEWAGRALILEPWQMFILWVLFGWKKEDGTRRFRIAYSEVARKNGKSTMASGVGNYLTIADGEPGAEVYTAATKRDQAKIVHEEAIKQVKASKDLSRWAKTFRNNISVVKTGSKYEPLGADSKTLDGLNPHGLIIDELHAHKTRDLWDVLDTARGARRQPMTFVITTAGYDRNSICFEQHDYSKKVLEGIVEDDSHFAFIASIDLPEAEGEEGDDWKDPSCWIKANPNLGVSKKMDYMMEQFNKALELPSQQNTFLRLHLDVWTEQATRWLPMEKWDACAGTFPVTDPEQRERLESLLEGLHCYAGLDLASTTDLTSFSLVFPPADPSDDEEPYYILTYPFIPGDTLHERVRRDRAPYDVWARQGLIEVTEGNVVDYNAVLNRIAACASRFDILELAYDDWNSSMLIQHLQEMGEIVVVPVRQGFKSLSPPTKELEKLTMEGRLAHGGHPALRWCMSNVMVETDAAENIKPSKKVSTERIDCVTSLVTAFARVIVNEGDTSSIYEERGILVL